MTTETIQNANLEAAVSTTVQVRTEAAPSSKVLVASLLGLLAAALSLPMWIVKYPPILDFPDHLARWFVLAHIHDARYQFSQFYSADWKPYPYILLDLIAVPLQSVLGIYFVGKLMLTACVLGVPLAAWFFLRRTNPENQHLALFAGLIAYNPQFLMGSLQNELSIALCFVALGIYVTYAASPSLSRWILLAFLMTLVYLTHLMGFAVAGVAVTCFCVLSRKPLRVLFLSWLAFVPGTICYIVSQRHLPRGGPAFLTYTSLPERIKSLAFPLRGYSTPVDILTITALLGCAVFMLVKNRTVKNQTVLDQTVNDRTVSDRTVLDQTINDRRIRLNWNWAGTLLVLVFLYFVVPSGIGETQGYINVRILLFAFIVALAALKSVGHKPLLVGVAVVLIAARCVDVTYHFIAAQPQFRTMEAAISQIPCQSRVLPVEATWDNNRLLFLRPIHVYAYGMIERGWLAPSLFHRPGVQPIRLKPVVYCPNEFCGPLNATEPDWTQVQRDYNYVWITASLPYRDQLGRAGEPIFSDGPLSVYRMNAAQSK